MKKATVKTVKTVKKATAKVITKEQKEARLTAYYASEYYLQVNKVNKETKEYSKSIKGARAVLLNAKEDSSTGLTPNFVKILKASKKSDAIFAHMTANVRSYKTGKYGTHTLLQYLRKNEETLIGMMKNTAK